MRASIFKDGEKAWYDGKGFIHNPFNVCYDEENFQSWSNGWWSVQDEMLARDRKILDAEYQEQIEKEAAEKESKEKSKTKKGRAELAGQNTLF